MVGGVIVGLTKKADGLTHVNVADCPHHPRHDIRAEGCKHPDECCVYTDAKFSNGKVANLKVGDSFWWQGGKCYWTPQANRRLSDERSRCGVTYDIPMRKIGYSH